MTAARLLLIGWFLPGVLGASAQPAPAFATYLGGAGGQDAGTALAFDGDGQLVVVGFTTSDAFPSTTEYGGGLLLGSDAFVARFHPATGAFRSASYWGGTGEDSALRVRTAPDGTLVMAGLTTSQPGNAPPATPPAGSAAVGTDGLLGRWAADAAPAPLTDRLGGSGDDSLNDLAVGADGDVYVVGTTTSPDLPVSTGAVQTTWAGGSLLGTDAFVARLRPADTGWTVVYLTYLGGAHDDTGLRLAVDAAGRAWVTGFTNSPDFPVQDPLQPAFAGPMREGEGDAWIARLSADGSRLDRASYVGGRGNDQPTALALDADGHPVLAGRTTSPDLPVTASALQPTRQGPEDAFLARLDAGTDGAWTWSAVTYLGGDGPDFLIADMVSTADGALWLTGTASADAWPVAFPDVVPVGGGDAWLARLSPEGDAADAATFGGSGRESVSGLAVRPGQAACLTGSTTSPDLPTPGGAQAAPQDAQDAFVVCFDPDALDATRPGRPTQAALHGNYPNPFTPNRATVIGFDVPDPRHVRLEVFDVLGRRIATLVDARYEAGRHEIYVDGRRWASGIYFYRIEMGAFTDTRSLVLVR